MRRRFAFSYASVSAAGTLLDAPLIFSTMIFLTFSQAKRLQASPVGPWPSKTPKKWWLLWPTLCAIVNESWFAFLRSCG